MQCKCSLNNNYEVIGLCDIKKFNQKISKFIDESWTQITIPEQIILPSNKPNIKNITKVYLNIKITSTKIVNTPYSDEENAEGLMLTGKILLVSGEICQNIVYIPECFNSSMCFVKFKNSFSTYIVIDDDVDSENDIYCVYSCVEDISARVLDGRVISKNVTLFLFAHRTTGGDFKKLSNEIKLNNQNGNPIVNIGFDATNKKIIVDSTGQDASDNFKMILYEFDATTEKKKSQININDDGDKFKNDFNDIKFIFGDLIKLEYQEKNRVVITNFPSKGKEYNPNHPRHEWFTITKRRLKKAQPFFLSEFIFKNSKDEDVAIVQFNKINKKLSVTSTGRLGDASIPFLFSLQRSDGTTVSGSISSLDASEFKRILDGQSFKYNDKIFISFSKKDKDNVILMNYPNDGDVYPMIANDNQEFKITPKGVVENIIPNVITLNSGPNYDPVVIIKIQVNGQKLLVSATSNKTNNVGGADYFKMTVNSKTFSVAGDSLADVFETGFNGMNIPTNSILKLECKEPGQVAITKFPTASNPVYVLKNMEESFKVTPNGLERST